MTHLEVETKFELNQSEFDCLKALGRVAHLERQLNVYYDAQWTLADKSATLRIRFIDGTDPVLSLKIPISRHGAQRVMQEIEITLSSHWPSRRRSRRPMSIDIEHELPAQFSEHLLCLGVTRVDRVGWVRNTRLVLEIEDHGQIELDTLELPDGSVVHEVEIESANDSAHEHLAQLVCQYAPQATPSTVSKFQRFRRIAEMGLE